MPDADFPNERSEMLGKPSDVASSAEESLDASLRWHDKRECGLQEKIGEQDRRAGSMPFIWQKIQTLSWGIELNKIIMSKTRKKVHNN